MVVVVVVVVIVVVSVVAVGVVVEVVVEVVAVVEVHSALKPVLVTDPSVFILTVMVCPVLVKGPGMEEPQNFSL